MNGVSVHRRLVDVLQDAAVPVPMDAQLSGSSLRHELDDADPVLVFTDAARSEQLERYGPAGLKGVPLSHANISPTSSRP